MATKQNPALLISGEEPRFVEGTLKFEKFLTEEAGFDSSNIRVILCTYMGGRYIQEETQLFFENLRRQGNSAEAVMLYNGHGGRGSFWPNSSSLTYEEWGRIINYDGKIVFINDSCYSGSAIRAFNGLGLLPRKGLVIASSRADEPSYGGIFLDRLTESLRSHKSFRKKELRDDVVVSGRVSIFSTGKIPEGLPEEGEIMEDGSVYMDYIRGGFEENYRHYKKPRTIPGKTLQHPVRSGRNLDYILMPER